MAELSTLARPYARAAFEYARDKGQLDAWAQALSVAAAVSSNDRVSAVLSSPAHTAQELAATVVDLCGDALGAEHRNFIVTLLAGLIHQNK